MRIKVFVGSFVILATIIGLFYSLSGENTTYYHTVQELKNEPQKYSNKKVRVMGLVEKGSISWEPNSLSLTFHILDENQNKMRVSYKGTKPDMFKEGQGVVAEGKLVNTEYFAANNLLVKHTEEYKSDPKKHNELKTKYYNSLKI